MENLYKALRKIGDVVSTYFKRVDDNFDTLISTDVVGAIAATLVVFAFIPVLVITFLIAMFVSLFNSSKDGETSSSDEGR